MTFKWNLTKLFDKVEFLTPSFNFKSDLRRRYLHLHELIGLPVRVVESSSTFKGLYGVVVFETKHTIIIKTHRSIKTIPKKGNVFAFLIQGEEILLEGSKICQRPEERLKRLKLKL